MDAVTYSYGSHPLQQIKVWNYDLENDDTYVYIHGGAWRDPRNTYDELAPVAEAQGNTHKSSPNQTQNQNQNQDKSQSKCQKRKTFIGINYRLSPEVHHPLHIIDIAKALLYIRIHFELQKIHIMGFSVGATMILQLFQLPDIIKDGVSALKESGYSNELIEVKEFLNGGFPQLRDILKENRLQFHSVKFLDGIYDVDALIEEYPSYESFVKEAYPSLDVAKRAISVKNDMLTKHKLMHCGFITQETKLSIVQSLEDDLLSMRQSLLLFSALTNNSTPVTFITGNWGKHDDVYGDKRADIFIYGKD